jgi:hypothetical protein
VPPPSSSSSAAAIECSAEPDPSLRHPEPRFSQLRLCGECHAALEPDIWRRWGRLGGALLKDRQQEIDGCGGPVLLS